MVCIFSAEMSYTGWTTSAAFVAVNLCEIYAHCSSPLRGHHDVLHIAITANHNYPPVITHEMLLTNDLWCNNAGFKHSVPNASEN